MIAFLNFDINLGNELLKTETSMESKDINLIDKISFMINVIFNNNLADKQFLFLKAEELFKNLYDKINDGYLKALLAIFIYYLNPQKNLNVNSNVNVNLNLNLDLDQNPSIQKSAENQEISSPSNIHQISSDNLSIGTLAHIFGFSDILFADKIAIALKFLPKEIVIIIRKRIQ